MYYLQNCLLATLIFCWRISWIFQLLQISNREVIANPADIVIPNVGNSDNYMSIFEDFILSRKPFSGSYGNDHNDESDIIIPAIAMNNYLWRAPLNVSIGSQYWPRIQNEDDINNIKNSDNIASKCDLNMNHLLWTSYEDMTIRLFHFNESNFSYESTEKYMKSYLLTMESSDIEYFDIVLQKNSYLFVPFTFLATLTSSRQYASACLVDASNYNDFVAALVVPENHINEEYASLYTIVGKLKPSSLLMTRMPRDVTLSVIVQSNFTDSTTAPSFVEATNEDSSVPSDRHNRRNRNKKSASGNVPSGNWKDWQATAKWKNLINSLTLPRPSDLKILYVGRTNSTLQWFSSFVPKESDTSIFGFNISICLLMIKECFYEVAYHQWDREVNPPRIPLIINVMESEDGRNELSIYEATIESLLPDTQYYFQVCVLYTTFSSAWSESTTYVTTKMLTPPSAIPCCLHAIPIFNSTVRCQLEFHEPIDDGGVSIEGYHIYALSSDYKHAYHSELMKTEPQWKHIGIATPLRTSPIVIMLSHIHTNTSYIFQVSAFNRIGESERSDSSNRIISGYSASAMLNTIDSKSLYPVLKSKALRHEASVHDDAKYNTAVAKYIHVDDKKQLVSIRTISHMNMTTISIVKVSLNIYYYHATIMYLIPIWNV